LIRHRSGVSLEILVVLLLEGLLKLFHLFADLIALEVAQPLLVVLGQGAGELIDAILLENARGDLGDGLTNALFIRLGRFGHALRQ